MTTYAFISNFFFLQDYNSIGEAMNAKPNIFLNAIEEETEKKASTPPKPDKSFIL